RRRTGEGQYIDFSQAEASMHFLAPAILDFTVNGRIAGRAGNVSAEHAPHGVYPCADGEGESVAATDRWVAIACATQEPCQALSPARGHPEWQRDPRFAPFAARQANREALDALIGAWTSTHDPEAIEHTLQAVRIPVHRAASTVDALADPQLRFRGHFVE